LAQATGERTQMTTSLATVAHERQSTLSDRVSDLGRQLFATRRHSLDLCSPLSAEDMTAQAMDDASPSKWHLAHVTWFFETFVLQPHLSGYRRFDDDFNYLFNSYYEALGPRQPRPSRGLLTRPCSARVFQYRAHVDDALQRLMRDEHALNEDALRLIEIGLNHEQQHQELLLTDILALFATNPIYPTYSVSQTRACENSTPPIQWIEYAGGVQRIGHRGVGFAWDNESPRHDALLQPYRLADRLVTNSEWSEFIADGGYRTVSLWLADGWATVQREGWSAPLYWRKSNGRQCEMTLHGLHPLNFAAPVRHISYFEADAFARWAGHRLPTEFEWEFAATQCRATDARTLPTDFEPSPATARATGAPRQMFGEVWQWTSSAYQAYPGFKPAAGAIGEYNGKFMVSQHVLRGSSCVTPPGHSRPTYRNFFYPHQRWQFAGLRLASDMR
jgi:ergothioneine biosynthesis protein EgtB